jgi:hypothetical protein
MNCHLPMLTTLCPAPNGNMPAATWGRIARLKLDFCDLLHRFPTAEKLAVFSQCKQSLLARYGT